MNKKTKSEYEAVVFDMDGVIFDSETGVLACWKELGEKYQIPHIEQTIYSCIGTNKVRTREIMLETYGPDYPYETYAQEASALFHERFDGGRLPMKPGVKELLMYLKGQKKKIALASSTRSFIVERELKDAGLWDYFDVVTCGDMVRKSKPDPEIFLLACKELEVCPSKAYAIEDSYNGIRAAHAGGLLPIMVPDLLPATEEMRELAERILPSLAEVQNYLTTEPVKR